MTTTLALIPGLLCDATVWSDLERELPDSVTTWVAEHGELASLPAMAQSALQHAPAGPLWVAGHSMGGRVALEMYRQAPERIAGLALLDTGWLPLAAGEKGEAERAARYALIDLARREGMRSAARQWAKDMVHPQQLDTPLFEAILAMIARRNPQIWEAQARALLARPDTSDLLGQITVPTLLACGRQDLWSPVAQHEQMAQRIPGSRLRVIEGAGHMAPMEQPAATAALLLEWLAPARPGRG